MFEPAPTNNDRAPKLMEKSSLIETAHRRAAEVQMLEQESASNQEAVSRRLQETRRIFIFLFVGCLSALSNLIVIAVLSHVFAWSIWVESAIATEISLFVNFFLNNLLTFHDLPGVERRPWYLRLLRFHGAALIGNAVTVVISSLAVTYLHLSPVISQTIAIFIAFILNFLMHRFWTFRVKGAMEEGLYDSGVQDGSGMGGYVISQRYAFGVSIIIPVLNEEAAIGRLLRRVSNAMHEYELLYEVIVIDDHSKDGTVALTTQVSEAYQLPVRVIAKQGNPGKAFSLMEGFAQAQYSMLAMIDGDLELPPEALPPMVQRLRRYQIVVGNRRGGYHREGLRNTLSMLFNEIICKWGFNLSCDVQTGIKVFYHDIYDTVDVHPGRWSFDLDFLAQANEFGYRICSYNVPFVSRKQGSSKVSTLRVASDILIHAILLKIRIIWGRLWGNYRKIPIESARP
jgi:putative flippase GtrA